MTEQYWFEQRPYRDAACVGGFTADDLDSMFEALRAAFPPPWVRRHFNRRQSYSPGPFHASPLSVIEEHPVPYRFCAPITDYSAFADVLTLARDLRDTQAVPGVTSVRRDLHDVSNFPGALFELEVLAELVRAGMAPRKVLGKAVKPDVSCEVSGVPCHIEIVHLKPTFLLRLEWCLTHHLGALLMMEGKEFAELSIAIDKGLGGANENPEQFAAELKAGVASMLSEGRSQCEGAWYSCVENRRGTPRSFTIRRKSGVDAIEALATKLFDTVQEKYLRQLKPIRNGLRLVAVDCRNLLVPESQQEHQVHRVIRLAVLGALRRVLRRRIGLDGILVWLNANTIRPSRSIGVFMSEQYGCQIISAFGTSASHAPAGIASLLERVKRTRTWLLLLRSARATFCAIVGS